ncbi:hypothetical protein GQ457_13G000500 [Hibiscus cannabinus]
MGIVVRLEVFSFRCQGSLFGTPSDGWFGCLRHRFCGRAHQIWTQLVRHDRLHIFNAIESDYTGNVISHRRKFRDEIVAAGNSASGTRRQVVSGSSSMASSGGVICDETGEWLFGFSKSICSCSVLVAELWAVMDVLLHAWMLGFRKVELEVDNIIVFHILEVFSMVLNGNALVARIREMLAR